MERSVLEKLEEADFTNGNIVHCGGIVVNVVIVILQEWVPKY